MQDGLHYFIALVTYHRYISLLPVIEYFPYELERYEWLFDIYRRCYCSALPVGCDRIGAEPAISGP